MLEHQLPALLPVTTFWGALPEFFDWLHGAVAQPLAAMPVGAGDMLIRERVLDFPAGSRRPSLVEMIRFAAAKPSSGKDRLPRQAGQMFDTRDRSLLAPPLAAGDVLLMAVRADSGQPCSYLVDSILGAEPTQTPFTPRYPIELTPSGPQSADSDGT